MDLTPEQTIIFIRLIKKYRLLWNPEDKDYLNKNTKHLTWLKIGSYFKLSCAQEAYDKYMHLLNIYLDYLKTDNATKNNTNKPFFFDEIDFLRPVVTENVDPNDSIEIDDDVQVIGEHNFISPTQPHYNQECINSDIVVQVEANEIPIASGTDNTSNFNNLSVCPPSGTIFIKSGPNTNTQPDWNDDLMSIDEFETFGKHIAMQLRSIDKISAIELMSHIQSAITKKRIELLSSAAKH